MMKFSTSPITSRINHIILCEFMTLTIISDVHGKIDDYLKIARQSEFTLQLGDFGFSSAWNALNYSGLSPDNHKICTGNHDDHDTAIKSPYCLGDYGTTILGGVSLFFIRGGLSIDRLYREVDRVNGGPRTYWTQEELNFTQMLECMDLYRKVKPSVVISHEPPCQFIPDLTSSDKMMTKYGFHKGFIDNTSLLCNELLNIHTPSLWIFGHFHHSMVINSIPGLKAVSLAELETYEIGDGS